MLPRRSGDDAAEAVAAESFSALCSDASAGAGDLAWGFVGLRLPLRLRARLLPRPAVDVDADCRSKAAETDFGDRTTDATPSLGPGAGARSSKSSLATLDCGEYEERPPGPSPPSRNNPRISSSEFGSAGDRTLCRL